MLLLVPLVIFVAYLVFGITGFGASPITIPVLVTRRQADTREVVTLVPFTLLGLTLGVTLLLRLPRDATLLALGLFVCAYAVNLMLRRESRRRVSRLWAAPAGIVSGLVGALFGMGGPPYVMYLILNVGLRVVAFALAGLLVSPTLWLAVAILLPVAWAGVWAGHRAHTAEYLHPMAGHVFAALRDGILKPDVRRRYPLAAAADAHRDLEARRTSGQIVLLV